MDLEETIKGRRSIRRYQDREIPTDTILKAISMAGWAPNNGNFQAWRFFVVKNRELIDRIADAVQSKVDLIASWPEAEEFRDTMNRHQAKCAFFRHAPVVIAVGMGGYQGPADRVLRKRGEGDPAAQEMIRNRKEISSRAQTIASAITLMLLSLHSMGLGACWLAGPMLARREISEMLQVPDGLELFAVVSVGYPAEDKEAGPRRPLEEIVTIL
ncbi:MAG: nitroreductase family protein [Chloroflexota bacterium]